ncbi:hypothetical protein BHE74_00025264 [Ensete ventricosum]|nr:hypothetical protein BHE74_00025264 [Ensete ventricosum]
MVCTSIIVAQGKYPYKRPHFYIGIWNEQGIPRGSAPRRIRNALPEFDNRTRPRTARTEREEDRRNSKADIDVNCSSAIDEKELGASWEIKKEYNYVWAPALDQFMGKNPI